MDKKELIRNFLIKSNIEFTESEKEFFLEKLNITIPSDGMPKLPHMYWSVIAMEVGMNSIEELMQKLEKLEGAQIYDFNKKRTN
jgi:hypothetical protein